jgi:3-methyladenine DNA glycosylase/8-oxoguanine DNA glycosylase
MTTMTRMISPLSRTVAAPDPINLAASLAPLRHGPSDPTARVGRGHVWWATRTAAGPATLHVSARPADAAIDGEAWGPGASAILDRLPAIVGADDEVASFRAVHPIVARMHRQLPGLRIPRAGSVVALLLPAILEQRVTTGEAHRQWAAVVRAYGEPAPRPADREPARWLRLPPSPDTLRRVPYFSLHRLGIERRRADVLLRVARHAHRLEEAATMTITDAYRRLRAIPGVGAWTAAVVGQVALGDADAVRLGDFHLPHQVAWALAGERRATDERLVELLEPYRGHRARVCRLIVTAGLGPSPRAPRRRLVPIASL